MPVAPDPRRAAADHLLRHPELVDRTRPFLDRPEVDWSALWRGPPWSSREERVLRAAADLGDAPRTAGMAPVRLSELADPGLWDPGPYSRSGEDHSHRVLEALGLRRGMTVAAARLWLARCYDTIARALDVWDWGALDTGVDAATHVLSGRRLADRTHEHLHWRSWPRVFESLASVPWRPDEQLMIEAARALSAGGEGPALRELATGLDDEQLSAVVEGLYIAWQQDG